MATSAVSTKGCRRSAAARALLLLAAGAFSCAAKAQEDRALVGLINELRGAASPCGDQPAKGAGPLAPNAVLARARVTADVPLQDALKAAGYPAARSLAITVSGPGDARSAMAFLAREHCGELASPQYSEVGVSRDGDRWQIVLARPVLSRDLGDWQAAGRRVLALVNAARAEPRACGKRRFAAAPPVRWNAQLAAASLAHSRDLAGRGELSHEGEGGTQAGDRVRREGYGWRDVGENVAAGQGSPEQVMAGWLASPGHCANIMDGRFKEMGAAYAVDRASEAAIYWTQVFAAQ
jgi:uncharacterized protein YkwD